MVRAKDRTSYFRIVVTSVDQKSTLCFVLCALCHCRPPFPLLRKVPSLPSKGESAFFPRDGLGRILVGVQTALLTTEYTGLVFLSNVCAVQPTHRNLVLHYGYSTSVLVLRSYKALPPPLPSIQSALSAWPAHHQGWFEVKSRNRQSNKSMIWVRLQVSFSCLA